MFAAIPLIAYLNWVYDGNVALGAIASALIVIGAIELGREGEKPS